MGTPTNGKKTPASECADEKQAKVGEECEFECDPGYQLKGSNITICTGYGNWYPRNTPKCTGRYIHVNRYKRILPAKSLAPIKKQNCRFNISHTWKLSIALIFELLELLMYLLFIIVYLT